ncbi:hypothetical protein CKM354_000723400 [Cercospora kikuchii]|uniref:Cytochrome P450 monooxygenase n=1 Tax=Cercospora kikuchii TaxID=84275 RepID=A0A9P3FIZ8_9PEZI|nr:uncharacterized protein CKM354_000723400 [Cercospora kikuchii]GIZ44025.1 hypothetical protein CKM354_000723400 [Cercospora kikuchii]
MTDNHTIRLVPTSISGAVLALCLLLIAYQLLGYIYNLFFHPLSKFPGPVACKASSIPYVRQNFKGDLVAWITKLHDEYGEVVRVAPNELSFSSADSYKDVYGFKKAGHGSLQKDEDFYTNPGTITRDIVNSDDANHARMRKIFSHAFSDRSLKLQEPLFLTHIDKMISKIREDPSKSYDMVKLYNCTTFDIMGDLTFGEPLGMLDNSDYHPWVAAIFGGLHFGVILHSMRMLAPSLDKFLLKYCMPNSIKEQMQLHADFSRLRVERRLEKQDARPDIWGLVLGKEEGRGLSKKEMYANAEIFMIAGTETTATLLSGVTFRLLTNPSKMQRLVQEIRCAFASEEEITAERLQALEYLHACLEEGLRMYSPVPQGLPRVALPGLPVVVDGHEVPPGSKVRVSNVAVFNNRNNFRDPELFVPERWLPNDAEGARYSEDKKHALQPFSTGPRNCLGKNMAYHEMRLILTKTLYNFDLTLCEESKQWADQKTYIMWEKKPLMVRLTPRKV